MVGEPDSHNVRSRNCSKIYFDPFRNHFQTNLRIIIKSVKYQFWQLVQIQISLQNSRFRPQWQNLSIFGDELTKSITLWHFRKSPFSIELLGHIHNKKNLLSLTFLHVLYERTFCIPEWSIYNIFPIPRISINLFLIRENIENLFCIWALGDGQYFQNQWVQDSALSFGFHRAV